MFGIGNKVFENKLTKTIEIAAKGFEILSKYIKKELETLKKRIIDSLIVILFVFVGFFVLMFNLGFFIEANFPNLKNGVGGMLLGGCLIIIGIIYNAIKNR